MSYKFEMENKNYEDYSSGRVFFNLKGTTSFPIRLASEIYQRCAYILNKQGYNKHYVLYDPCCGGAFMLTSIGFLHGSEISKIYASDIDENVISLAQRNLSLLSHEGLEKRINQIKEMVFDFGKESHLEALQSALALRSKLSQSVKYIETKCFTKDITNSTHLINNIENINILITDLPYGDIVNWRGMENQEVAIEQLLNNVLPVLADNSVISIISKKKVKITHEKYRKIEKFIIGKRQVIILQPAF